MMRLYVHVCIEMIAHTKHICLTTCTHNEKKRWLIRSCLRQLGVRSPFERRAFVYVFVFLFHAAVADRLGFSNAVLIIQLDLIANCHT